jgi:ubiquitin C-terminal hydrolase
MSHTPELNHQLSQLKKLDNSNSSVKQANRKLLVAWISLQNQLWTSNEKDNKNGLCSRAFHQAFQQNIKVKEINNGFVGFNPNDVSEFLSLFVDSLHGALSRKVRITISGAASTKKDKIAVKCYETMQTMYSNDYSEMLPVFFGVYVSEIVSRASGEMLSFKPDPFFEINLSVPSPSSSKKETVSLHDCLRQHCAEETIEGYMNEKTKQVETIQRHIRFWSLPTILVFSLKRFDAGQKQMVDFPFDIDMSEYAYNYDPTKTNQKKYELYGVCHHYGGARGGHYVATVKHAVTNEWFVFDDETVTKLNSDSLEKIIVRPSAYCLFYRKRNL